jgi:dipeptidyl-peptidase-4
MRKNLFWVIWMTLPLFLVQAQPAATKSETISLEDIWLRYAYFPEFPNEFRWMNDDRYYSVLEPEGDNQVIARYSVEDDSKDRLILSLADVDFGEDGNTPEIKSYAFSADETRILLISNRTSIYRHSSKETCHVWDSEAKKLSSIHNGEQISNAAFSPDGKRLAFVYKNNLYMHDLATGKETAITSDGKTNEVINGATDWVYEEEFSFAPAFFWSPDSRRIAFYKFNESRVKQFTMPIYGSLYPELYEFKYPKAGEENAIVNIFMYDTETAKTVQAETGSETDQYIPRITWAHNPIELGIMRMNRLQNKLDVLLADPETGKTRTLLTEKTDTYIEVTDDKWQFLNSTGELIWMSEETGYNHVYRYDRQGKLVNAVTHGSFDVSGIVSIDEENELLYYMSTEVSPLERHLYSVQLDGKKKKQLTDEPGKHEVEFSTANSYFVDSYSTATHPGKTVLSNSKGKPVRQLIDNENLAKKLDKLAMKAPEFFSFRTAHDVELNGWMIKPPDFDENKEYPVLMYVYGGPGSQTVSNEWGYFNYMWYQMLAQQGYIIVSVDNRGTGGRGRDFRAVTYADLGKYETIDQIDAARYLGELDYVDEDRIGIWGWSYGGYMTSLCLTKGEGVFKMGIAVAPVTNWRFYDTIYTERYLKRPQENAAGYDDNSPINFADKLQGSYLVVHGGADDNVHLQNTMEWVNALVRANKQFDMFIYPNKNHSIAGGVTRYHLYKKMTDFIQENL